MMGDIVRQTFTDWELIVVSNGAEQEPQLTIARSIAAAQPEGKIKVISVERGGVSNARNVGIKAAAGEWLTFVDADDRLEPDHLRLLMDATATGDVDMVMSGYTIRWFYKPDAVVKPLKWAGEFITIRDFLNIEYWGSRDSVWSKLFKTSTIRRGGYAFNPDYTIREDCFFIMDVLLGQDDVKLKAIPLCGYIYFKRDEESALSTYRPDAQSSRQHWGELWGALMRKAGYDENQIAEATRPKYSDYTGAVTNLFSKSSPYSLAGKRRQIRRIVYDDPQARQALSSFDTKGHLFLKIFRFAYRTGSATAMTAILQTLFWARYSMRPLFKRFMAIRHRT